MKSSRNRVYDNLYKFKQAVMDKDFVDMEEMIDYLQKMN